MDVHYCTSKTQNNYKTKVKFNVKTNSIFQLYNKLDFNAKQNKNTTKTKTGAASTQTASHNCVFKSTNCLCFCFIIVLSN